MTNNMWWRSGNPSGKEDPLAFLAVVPGSQSLSDVMCDVLSAVNARENLCGLLFVHAKRNKEQTSCRWLYLFQCLVKPRMKADLNCSSTLLGGPNGFWKIILPFLFEVDPIIYCNSASFRYSPSACNGFTFVCTCFRVNGEDVRLMLWDTAGQEEFDAITKAYYRGETVRNAAIFFFSCGRVFGCEVRGLNGFETCVWSCRCSGLCAGLLHHRQRILWGHQQLEGESGDWGRGHSHRPGAEQNRSTGRHGYQKVRFKPVRVQ